VLFGAWVLNPADSGQRAASGYRAQVPGDRLDGLVCVLQRQPSVFSAMALTVTGHGESIFWRSSDRKRG